MIFKGELSVGIKNKTLVPIRFNQFKIEKREAMRLNFKRHQMLRAKINLNARTDIDANEATNPNLKDQGKNTNQVRDNNRLDLNEEASSIERALLEHKAKTKVYLSPLKINNSPFIHRTHVKNRSSSNYTSSAMVTASNTQGNLTESGSYEKKPVEGKDQEKSRKAKIIHYSINETQGHTTSKTKNDERTETDTKSSISNTGNIDSRNDSPLFMTKYSVCSKPGIAFGGMIKTNQDSFLTMPKILGNQSFAIYGVFDGHGVHGHFVSGIIKNFFNDYYSRYEIYKLEINESTSNKRFLLRNSLNLRSLSVPGNTLGADCVDLDFYQRLKNKDYQLIRNSFHNAESVLSQSTYDVNHSGSTAVMLFLVGNKLICANAGDSRAILYCCYDGENRIFPISRDHKPELRDEKSRILNCNGRVERYEGDGGYQSGPYRVWIKGHNIPGLAMSRSIGDLIASTVGVTCEPEISEVDLTKTTPKFVVIASDGIWEFLSNEKVCSLVLPFYKLNDTNGAADKLVAEATRLWKKVFHKFNIKDGYIVDDITVIVIFFAEKQHSVN